MTTINHNTNNPWNSLMKETGELFTQAADAVTDAGHEFVENTAKRFGDAGDAFEKNGIVSGLIETADALSLGSRAADLADAIGLVENKAGKEAVSALTNAMSNPLWAVKDLFDLKNEVMSPLKTLASTIHLWSEIRPNSTIYNSTGSWNKTMHNLIWVYRKSFPIS